MISKTKISKSFFFLIINIILIILAIVMIFLSKRCKEHSENDENGPENVIEEFFSNVKKFLYNTKIKKPIVNQ